MGVKNPREVTGNPRPGALCGWRGWDRGPKSSFLKWLWSSMISEALSAEENIRPPQNSYPATQCPSLAVDAAAFLVCFCFLSWLVLIFKETPCHKDFPGSPESKAWTWKKLDEVRIPWASLERVFQLHAHARAHTYTHTLTHTYTHTHSHIHTHSLTHTHTLTHTYTHTLSLSLSLSHTHTHTLCTNSTRVAQGKSSRYSQARPSLPWRRDSSKTPGYTRGWLFIRGMWGQDTSLIYWSYEDLGSNLPRDRQSHKYLVRISLKEGYSQSREQRKWEKPSCGLSIASQTLKRSLILASGQTLPTVRPQGPYEPWFDEPRVIIVW
jgi:hypothetical protein